jgi:5-methyltetrahydrofolate--homocysteine methyltransferase
VSPVGGLASPPVPRGRRLLDGAMGTALLARGLPAGVPPEAWLRERPGEIAAVHRAHAGAGARLLLTCTFNLASTRVEGHLGPGGVPAAGAAAVALARAEARGGLVAGALGPLALAVPGGEAPPPEALERPFQAPLRALAGAGVDLVWLESQYDGREAAAALAAARPLGLPVVVTFALALRGGRLVTAAGAPAEPLLLAAVRAGASAVGVNCVPAGPALAALAGWARSALPVPFVAKPSPGPPGAVLPPAAFAAAAAPAVRAGAAWLGGCCGADAGHVSALAEVLLRHGGAG